MISDKFIFLAALIGLQGSGAYALAVIRGKAKPNRVSWTLWAIIPMIAFFAQLDEKVGLESIMTFMVGFGPFVILIASFFRKDSYWNITKLDITCAILSCLAITLWITTGNGNTAIALSIAADFLAAIPTLHKAFYYPETEHTSAFRNAIINSGITLLIIDTWNFANYAFAVYIFVIGIVLYSLIKFKIGKRLTA